MADIEKRDAPPPSLLSEQSTAISAKPLDRSSSDEDVNEVRERILMERELQKSEPPVLPITTLFGK
jgi:hypothetical protein